MKLRNSLRRLTAFDVLVLAATAISIAWFSLLIAGVRSPWMESASVVIVLGEVGLLGGYLVYALGRRRQRLRARFALLKDDPTALEDAERRSEIGRRIHRRLVRRALGTAPTALVVALGGLVFSVVLAGIFPPLGLLSPIFVVIALGNLVWRPDYGYVWSCANLAGRRNTGHRISKGTARRGG